MKTSILAKLTEISNKYEIRLTVLKRLLQVLIVRKKILNNDLVRMTGIPKNLLHDILAELSEILMPTSKYVEINNNLKSDLKEELNLIVKNVNFDKKNILKLLKKYNSQRPAPDRNYDQFTATNKTTVRRIEVVDKYGDIEDKIIAVIGDDDLNSVALAMTKKAKKIISFEVDERIINLINKIAIENDLKIQTVKCDVKNELPKEFMQKFDVIITDPPYTPNGISLFLNRGIELLKQKLTSRIYLSYGNSDRARERELEVQKIIIEKGLLIKDKKNQFSRYYGAESIGSRSSLYLLDWTPKTKVIKNQINKIYTNEQIS